MTIRVLIVDDSPTMRAILLARLSSEHDIEVVAAACDAVEGRAMIKQYNPDVVTLDIEMPGMNGLDFLEKIMTLRPTPVIVVSGSTHAGSEATARALSLGAVDCYDKHDRSGQMSLSDGGKLANLIRQASQIRFENRQASVHKAIAREAIRPHAGTKVIAIGASTGGVEALQRVLSDFPVDCPPTLVVQHVNPSFAGAIALTLDKASPARVQLADNNMELERGNVYLAPGGDCHMQVGGVHANRIRLVPGDRVSGHRPSVDMLFHSVAKQFGAGAVGIILTGMGQDGAQGMLAMKQAGAFTIAQDENSCTVYGMPRAAAALGAVCDIAPLATIASRAFERKAA